MKAPSLLCLHALRRMVHRPCSSQSPSTSQRCLASVPKRPPPALPATPPPSQRDRRPRVQHDNASDDEEKEDDHTPRPLMRPLGMPEPPQPGSNSGRDQRSLRTRRDDFVDYNKHLARRAQMTKEISKPYFRDWSNLKYSKGKGFIAPERLFRAETARFFPNLLGRTIGKRQTKTHVKDGYAGLGRDTCVAMRGKVSVVSLFTSTWAAQQVQTFQGAKAHAALEELLRASDGLAQRVEINYEDNTLRYWILRLFGMRGLRKERSLEEQERYFIVRRGFDDALKAGLGVENEKAGYVYLVDPQCRIRWAGSAIAEDRERESLVRGVKKLIQEAKGQRVTKAERRESASKGVIVGDGTPLHEKRAVAMG